MEKTYFPHLYKPYSTILILKIIRLHSTKIGTLFLSPIIVELADQILASISQPIHTFHYNTNWLDENDISILIKPSPYRSQRVMIPLQTNERGVLIQNSSLIVAVNKKLPQQRHLLTTPATEILQSRFAINGLCKCGFGYEAVIFNP